jgi:hypothetical protein
MKKFITLFFAFVMSMAAFAQSEHMKFMGIPLDGTISDFQSKLLAKGATLNSRLNAQYPFGVVVFNGVFRGENANFFIYRGKESDIVYRAKVSITKKYEEKFEAKYDELKKYIRATYKGTEKIDECCGHESYSVMVGNGAIQLTTSEVVENKQRVYVIYIDYVDKNNLYDCDVTLYYKIKSDFQSGVNKNMVQSYNNEHMKFMGIPLDGTINTFQSKLVAKGMTPNVSMNKILPIGGRAFDGYFAGYKATILVAYEKKTKVVYGAKVCISVTNEDDLEEKYNEFKDLIKSKYDGEEKIEEINGREVYTVEIESGIINLVASVDIDGYSLQLTYCDYENSMKYIDSQLDDI